MKGKQGLSVFLCAVMAAAAIAPANVFAVGGTKTEVFQEKETFYEAERREGLPDNEDLFSCYVEELFLGDRGILTYGNYAEEKLTGIDLAAYGKLKENILKIAAGEQTDTRITLTLEDLGITKTEWTAEDLGVSKLAELSGGTIHIDEAASAAMWEKITPDFGRLLNYLLMDCPYDFYWYDKTASTGSSFNKGISVSTKDGVNFTFSIEGISLIYTFPVAEGYRGAADYTVDASRFQTAQTAAENAKEIVKKYAGYSDYDKLSAYKREICELVEYNTEAAESGDTPYGDPWQLIWVFDKDESTNVVCEGYSKAFQYLCDMSEFFDSGVRCYTVTGTMNGGTGAGAHMWNIVTMENRKNYIADVTNCDGNSIGADDKLFLAGATGSAAEGYTVTVSGHPIVYVYAGQNPYEPDMSEMYGDILQIAPEKYEFLYIDSGTFGGTLGWTLDGNGYLNIKGSGPMPEPKPAEGEEIDLDAAPWSGHKSNIKRVVIEEGITSVSTLAFPLFDSIEEISLPESLTSIGEMAFAGSGIQKLELPQNLETIGSYAFFLCRRLSEIELPSGVKEIGFGAFSDCAGLTELRAPKSVEKIGAEAFKNCSALTDFWFFGECPEFVPAVDENEQLLGSAFSGDALTIHYPSKYAQSWQDTAAAGFEDADVKFSVFCGEEESDHDWEAEASVDEPATCEKEGVKSVHCRNCDAVKEREIIPMTAHGYGEWEVTKESGCLEKGERQRVCAVCSHTETEEIPANGHRLVNADHEKYYMCTACGKKFLDAEGKTEISDEGTQGGDGGNSKDEEAGNPDTPPLGKPEEGERQTLVNRIVISGISKKIAAGKKVSLSAKVFPENAQNKAVVWTSDNPKYAVVNGNGVVTVKPAGKGKTVTVKAAASDGSGVTASFRIKIMPNAITKVKIQNAKKTLRVQKTVKLKAVISKNGPKINKVLRWTTSNEAYASVNSKGVVKAKKAGKGKTVRITAMATDGSGKKSTVKIKIK